MSIANRYMQIGKVLFNFGADALTPYEVTFPNRGNEVAMQYGDLFYLTALSPAVPGIFYNIEDAGGKSILVFAIRSGGVNQIRLQRHAQNYGVVEGLPYILDMDAPDSTFTFFADTPIFKNNATIFTRRNDLIDLLIRVDPSTNVAAPGAPQWSHKYHVDGSWSLSGYDGTNFGEIFRGNVGASGAELGFFGVTPVPRTAAWTQNYATGSRIVDAYTPDDQSTPYTGIDNAQLGSVYGTAADLNTLRTAYENLRASHDNLLQAFTQLLDDLQAYGLEQ